MKKLLHITLLLLSFTAFGQHSTELKGFVKNIAADTLILAKSYQDLRYNGTEIPVAKSKEFRLVLKHQYVEEYVFVYKSELKNGMWRPITFFPNGNTITFELYPIQEYAKNKISGDTLGQQKKRYEEALGEKFSKTADEIYGELYQLEKDGREVATVKLRLDSLNKKILAFQYDYFLQDTSIVGLDEYVILLENAKQMLISPEIFKPYQTYYVKLKPKHPLTERAQNLYIALTTVKVGQHYVDIALEDRNDIAVKLSELLQKETFTILDLWSPWCGPCIAKSRKVKENYSKLSKNVQIIGVVGGIDRKEKAEKAIDRFAYPWKNYLEVANKNKIWEKYGISNAGGAQFLINQKGEIVAINPTIEDLLKIIQE
ncbi:MAG: TlpA disulfide reductase family protein [Bacteroidota bacterium]